MSSAKVIPVTEVLRFMVDCLKAAGASKCHADQHAFTLCEADRRGIFSHGLNRLDRYINELETGKCDGKAMPTVLKETPASAWVDGCNTFGSVAANFCMDLAIKKSKDVGVGFVSCKDSNHYGIGAIYAYRALEANVFGFCATNTPALMAPTRAKNAALGTNPISCAAPAGCGDSFVLDMATTAVAWGKIEVSKQKKQRIPIGWALNMHGMPTTDPEEALKARLLMPLGGTEQDAGYKGFGLACMVEILCGILAGADFGPFVLLSKTGIADSKLGQCFLAIDPKHFAPGFSTRLSTLLDFFRNMEPAEPGKPVKAPGDLEKQMLKMSDEQGGIKYMERTLEICNGLSKKFKVRPLGCIE